MNNEPVTLIHGYLDGELTDDQQCKLNDWLHQAPGNIERFVNESRLHSELCDIHNQDAREDVPSLLFSLNDQPSIVDEPQASAMPVVVLGPSPITHSSLFDLSTPLGSFVFSYSVAAVLLGLGMLIGSVTYVTHYTTQFARTGSGSEKRQPFDKFVKPTYVGEITGMVDVKWVDLQKAPLSNYVILGRQYDLASGLVEITYDTGVRVILQGPCTYEVESTNGGYLSLGKLTAQVGGRGEGRGEREAAAMAGRRASNPQSLIPNSSSSSSPLFAVRTPTAVVTDLGTEFGVEVTKSGDTESYVYRGKVEVRVVDDKADTAEVVALKANESARIAAGESQIITVIRDRGRADEPKEFVREMPKPPPRVLLCDTFDNAADSSMYGKGYGLNECLLTRQSGLCRPVSYIRGGDCAASYPNAQVSHFACLGKLNLIADYGQAGWVVLDRNFPKNVEVTAEIEPAALHCSNRIRGSQEIVSGNLTSENWVALGIRGRWTQLNHRELPLASDAGIVLQMRANGKWAYFENGKQIIDGNVAPARPYRVVMRVVGDQLTISINGESLKLEPNEIGAVRTLDDFLATPNENFISLGASNVDSKTSIGGPDISSVENLTIREARPNTDDGDKMGRNNSTRPRVELKSAALEKLDVSSIEETPFENRKEARPTK